MIFDSEILIFDFSKIHNVSGYYYLADLSEYKNINIQLTWVGINATDCYTKYAQKNDISVINWDTSTIQKVITLTTTDDSAMIEINNFTSKIVGIFIEKGNVTQGILRVRIFAKD